MQVLLGCVSEEAAVQLRLMRETIRDAGLTADSLTCAQQALIFISSARSSLHQLQSDGGVPYLFPECWICLASLGIASVLVQTLNAAAEAPGGGGGGVTGATASRPRAALMASNSTANAQRLSVSERVFGTPDALHDLIPPAVAVPVSQLLETLKASQEQRGVPPEAEGGTGGAAEETARRTGAAQPPTPDVDASQLLSKMHLVVAQVLANAYLVRVSSSLLVLGLVLSPSIPGDSKRCRSQSCGVEFVDANYSELCR